MGPVYHFCVPSFRQLNEMRHAQRDATSLGEFIARKKRLGMKAERVCIIHGFLRETSRVHGTNFQDRHLTAVTMTSR
jgi:hypothetical protein